LALRESLHVHAPADTVHAEAIELPEPRLIDHPPRDEAFELDPEHSSVRFLVQGGGRNVLVRCPAVAGKFELRAEAAASKLELRFDLSSLAPIEPGTALPTEADLRHLLGIHRGEQLEFRATLLSTATSPVPGLVHRLWLGSLRFGGRIVRQPMGLWQTALPGQPVRLQGYGTVGAADYGLPRRSWFGLVEEHHVVTLGLDLAWKRRPPR
jgi:hypothetical protein